MTAILLAVFSTLFAGVALGISVLSYLARNRPYVWLKELSLSGDANGLSKKLTIEIENVGDVPATDVVVNLTDSAGFIETEDSSIPLGAVFPHQSLSFNLKVPAGFAYAPDKEKSYSEDSGDGSRIYHTVFPEEDGTEVVCNITYRQLLVFGLHLWAYHTRQSLHLAPNGQVRPSISQPASIN